MAKEGAFHPLFLPDENSPEDFRPGPIAWIFVSRWEKGGKLRVPQRFKPDQLREESDIMSRWGGGDYELEARLDNGQIYAKRSLSLPGAPKALAPDDAGGASAPALAAAPATAPVVTADPMLALVLEMGRQQQALMLGMFSSIASVAAAVLARPSTAAPAPPASSPAEMMTAVASLVQATKPPAPAPMAEVLGVMNAIDKAAEQRTEQARSAAKDLAPGESVGEVVKAVGEIAMPLLAAAAQAKPPVVT